MRSSFLVAFFIILKILPALAGNPPYNYFNLNFGIAKFKSPMIYTYSLEYCRDINLTERSSFLYGAEWENFYQKEDYDLDTNFVFEENPTGSTYASRNYYRTEKNMFINLAFAYKFWLKREKNNSIYLQSEINFNFLIRELSKGEYYYRDINNTLFLGPYSYKHIVKNDDFWIPKNIRPSISVGYLKTINKRLAYQFKLDLIIASPHQTPREQGYVYPKVGVGLGFR